MWRYLRDPTFSRFDTITECDRHTHTHTQTDRQTDTRRRHIPRLAQRRAIKMSRVIRPRCRFDALTWSRWCTMNNIVRPSNYDKSNAEPSLLSLCIAFVLLTVLSDLSRVYVRFDCGWNDPHGFTDCYRWAAERMIQIDQYFSPHFQYSRRF